MKKFLLLVSLLFSAMTFAQSWVSKADSPEGKHHPISFALDGKGYSITGTNSAGQPTDDVFEYDPITDSWNVLSDFPGLARSFGIGTTANGKGYFGFGATNSAYLKDFWSFDPSNGAYTQLASCDCSSRRHPAMISIGNSIYVGLGNDEFSDKNDWWVYSIKDNVWTQLADLPGPARHHPYMFNAGGEVFAGLGHSGPTIFRDWYKLDTVLNTWTIMSQFPGEGRVAGTQFDMNGYGFILSGDGDNHDYMDTGEMWRYNPTDDTWLQFPPHPGKSRWAPGSFVINDEVFFFGGVNRFTNTYPKDLTSIDISAATLGNEKEVLENTYFYPNPVNDIISWEFDPSITEVVLINSIGQWVAASNTAANQMDVSNLMNGVYFVQFYAKNGIVKTSKAIIQH
jgi:N-acetylneuraminic acid mutarotase